MKKVLLLAALLAAGSGAFADSTTTRMGLVKPTIGSSGWGVKTNTNWDIVASSAAALFASNTFYYQNTFLGRTYMGSGETLVLDVNGGINMGGGPRGNSFGWWIGYGQYPDSSAMLKVNGVSVFNGNVGISSGVPTFPLVVAGTAAIQAVRFNDGTYMTTASGGLAIGSAITSATQGSMLFASTSGVLGQSNSQIFWSQANGRLGVMNNSPSYTLDVTGTGRFTGQLLIPADTVVALGLSSPADSTAGIGIGNGEVVIQAGTGITRKFYFSGSQFITFDSASTASNPNIQGPNSAGIYYPSSGWAVGVGGNAAITIASNRVVTLSTSALVGGSFTVSGGAVIPTMNGNTTLNGTLTATNLAGAGASITALTAANISSGNLGAGVVASSVAVAAVGISQLSATGTPSASTFLRGDNTWSAASGSGIAIGNAVTGGGANRVLFQGADQTLDAVTGMTYSTTTGNFTVGGLVVGGATSLAALSATAGTFTSVVNNLHTNKVTGDSFVWADVATPGVYVATLTSTGNLTLSGTLTATLAGNGASITNISGSNVSGGTFGAVNGSALTSLTAANIAAGTFGTGVLISTVPNNVPFGGGTARAFLFVNTSTQIAQTAAVTNGMLLIGSTNANPVAATLTGTSNQVVVTNGAGSITLSTPQSIGTGNSVTFAGLTLSAGITQTTTLSGGSAYGSTFQTIRNNGIAGSSPGGISNDFRVTATSGAGAIFIALYNENQILPASGGVTASQQIAEYNLVSNRVAGSTMTASYGYVGHVVTTGTVASGGRMTTAYNFFAAPAAFNGSTSTANIGTYYQFYASTPQAGGYAFYSETGNSVFNANNVAGSSATFLGDGIVVGSGNAAISNIYRGSASLDFGATAGGACDDLTITVTGVVDGDPVALGVPNALAASDSTSNFTAFVSATNTVDVRRCCELLAGNCSNPAAATVVVRVVH